jgi:hypothetical protein
MTQACHRCHARPWCLVTYSEDQQSKDERMTVQQRIDAAPKAAADLRTIRAAQVALAWVVVFVAFHVYWFLGGSFVSPGKLPGDAHVLADRSVDMVVDGAFVLGFLVPLAITRGWAGGRLAKPVAFLVWVGAVILDLRGGSGVIDNAVRAAGVRTGISGISTKDATGLSHLTWGWWAIEINFLTGGLIFTWLALRNRRPAAPGATE